MPSDCNSRPKSLNHDWPAFLTFINRTNVPVDILWADYHGNLVRYRSRLGPGEHHYQNTYMSHPWVAWNSETQDKLIIGGQFVFSPQPWGGEQQRTVVFIDRPVLSLLKLCVQKIRLLVKADNVEDLEIPRELFDTLKKRQRAAFQDCHPHQRR